MAEENPWPTLWVLRLAARPWELDSALRPGARDLFHSRCQREMLWLPRSLTYWLLALHWRVQLPHWQSLQKHLLPQDLWLLQRVTQTPGLMEQGAFPSH